MVSWNYQKRVWKYLEWKIKSYYPYCYLIGTEDLLSVYSKYKAEKDDRIAVGEIYPKEYFSCFCQMVKQCASRLKEINQKNKRNSRFGFNPTKMILL